MRNLYYKPYSCIHRISYFYLFLFLHLKSSILVYATAPFELITRDGNFKSEKSLFTYLSSEELGKIEISESIVAIMDLCSESSVDVVNKILSTQFKSNKNGSI